MLGLIYVLLHVSGDEVCKLWIVNDDCPDKFIAVAF